MSDQCAQDSDGNLKDASKITFYESESDEKALPAVPSGPLRRGIRKRNTDKLAEGLTAENADEDGNPQMKRAPRAGTARAARVQTVAETPSEEEDDDFEMPGLEDVSDSDDSDSEYELVDNNEANTLDFSSFYFQSEGSLQLSDILASKTVPARGGASSKPQTRQKASAGKRKQLDEPASAPPAKKGDAPPKKATRVTIEEVEDEGDIPKATQFKNPIYLFFDVVAKNSEGSTGKPGDKHYKCRHGNGRILTVTRAMRYNVGGLTTHLKKEFPVMYRLYWALYTRKDEPPTQHEIQLARGDVPIDSEAAKAYLGKLESATASIIKSLENQAKKARVIPPKSIVALVFNPYRRVIFLKMFLTLFLRNTSLLVTSRLTPSRSPSSFG
ncbi:hypothetical protein B0H11DRAFT_1910397 [Mycena galericulata]|nr:hypothetical protein B0H11DRAFT_1910397 [Mycena galericulata]